MIYTTEKELYICEFKGLIVLQLLFFVIDFKFDFWLNYKGPLYSAVANGWKLISN